MAGPRLALDTTCFLLPRTPSVSNAASPRSGSFTAPYSKPIKSSVGVPSVPSTEPLLTQDLLAPLLALQVLPPLRLCLLYTCC